MARSYNPTSCSFASALIERKYAAMLTAWAGKWQKRIDKGKEYPAGTLKTAWLAPLTEAHEVAAAHKCTAYAVVDCVSVCVRLWVSHYSTTLHQKEFKAHSIRSGGRSYHNTCCWGGDRMEESALHQEWHGVEGEPTSTHRFQQGPGPVPESHCQGLSGLNVASCRLLSDCGSIFALTYLHKGREDEKDLPRQMC